MPFNLVKWELTAFNKEIKTHDCPDILNRTIDKYELLVYQGDGLMANFEYQKAESIYHKALQLHKSLPKNKENIYIMDELNRKNMMDTDVKYKIYQCCYALKNYQDAVAILDTIPRSKKTVKMNDLTFY